MVDPTKVMGIPTPPAGWLLIRSGRLEGRDHRLATETTIGRDGTRCDLILDNESVSAEHARLRYERGQFILYDLASTNGTFVNGQRVSRIPLSDGDNLSIGGVQMVFKEVRSS